MRYIYLHGFASGPSSRKAQGFRAAFAAREVELEIPALDGSDFEHLTITGQLKIVEELLSGEPASLMGSSMGGYLAALYASRHAEVARLVLMAPAFSFSERWHHLLGEERLAEWRETGALEVFHYGTGTQRSVAYELYDDSRRHPALPEFEQEALIFHGTGDAVVPVELSRDFSQRHSNAHLTELDSDHELTDVLSLIVERSCAFLLDSGQK